jgi:hypothetical protein
VLALLNMVAKFTFRKMRQIACFADKIFTSQEGFCFKLVVQSLGLLVSQSVIQSVHT